MKRCKHRLRRFETAVVYGRHRALLACVSFGPGWTSVPGQHRCDSCGEIIPLGPSNDAGEAVEIEIAAAWLAGHRSLDGCEQCGWEAHRCDYAFAPSDVHDQSDFQAGYLAREIATHEEP